MIDLIPEAVPADISAIFNGLCRYIPALIQEIQ